jgi:hypothetical protein
MNEKKNDNTIIDYKISELKEPFYTKKNLIIQQDVKNAKLKAKGNIISYADCENCLLESETGTVFLLMGSLSSTNIVAAKNIYVKHSLKSNLIAGQDIIIEKSVFMSELKAGNKIINESKESKIVGGTSKANTFIISNEIGNSQNVETKLILTSFNAEVIFGKLYKGVKVKIGDYLFVPEIEYNRSRIRIINNKINVISL